MTAIARQSRKLTVPEFLAFYETRPDEEQWQLIDGVALLMTPPLVLHQVIASNLQQVLNETLVRTGAAVRAYQRIGVELAQFPHYRPEPDVVVIDREVPYGQRYVERFYLAAEILSEPDEDRAELKRGFYRSHEHNLCVLLISQDRVEAEIDLRTGDRWRTSMLRGGEARLELPNLGLGCRLADLYRNTPLEGG